MNARSLKAAKGSVRGPQPARKRAKRLPAETRKAIILKEASDFFAENGFAASTRDLADRIGVRQALLYKYFPSKEALIEAIFERVIAERDDSPKGALNTDTTIPLADRILDFYGHVATIADGSGVRLISRAVMEDLPVGMKLTAYLKQKLFLPILKELRGLEKAPTIEDRPMTIGEYELLLLMHTNALFFLLRRNLRNHPLPADPQLVIRLDIDMLLLSVRNALHCLHGPNPNAFLAQPIDP